MEWSSPWPQVCCPHCLLHADRASGCWGLVSPSLTAAQQGCLLAWHLQRLTNVPWFPSLVGGRAWTRSTPPPCSAPPTAPGWSQAAAVLRHIDCLGWIFVFAVWNRPCSCVCVLATQLCPTLQPHGLWPSRLLSPWGSPGKNTGVGCHFLLQGIFLTQGLNPGLPHCRQILYLSEPPGNSYAGFIRWHYSVDFVWSCFHISSGPWAHLKKSRITDMCRQRSVYKTLLWRCCIWILKFPGGLLSNCCLCPTLPGWALSGLLNLAFMRDEHNPGLRVSGKHCQDGMRNRPEQCVHRLLV